MLATTSASFSQAEQHGLYLLSTRGNPQAHVLIWNWFASTVRRAALSDQQPGARGLEPQADRA